LIWRGRFSDHANKAHEKERAALAKAEIYKAESERLARQMGSMMKDQAIAAAVLKRKNYGR